MRGPEGGLTFVFTDIEGSTRLVEELRSEYGLALRICKRMLVNAFAAHDGREFGSEGDGQFFVFSAPATAAAAAVDLQRRAAAAEWPGGVRFRIRIGIHCGPVRVSGGEYVGMTVHEVARICSAANGGQILCSAPVASSLADVPELSVVPLGRYVLRGIEGAQELYQVGADDLDGDLAPPRDAVREGGGRVVVWRRNGGAGGSPRAAIVTPADGGKALDWSPLVPGVDVAIHGRDETLRLIVSVDGTVHEEYDGLTVGGESDAVAVVNALSRFVVLSYAPRARS